MTTMQEPQKQVRAFPSPHPLATVTDLKPEEVKAITEAVNPLIADAFALYVKTKNFHWHLSGSHFRDYHLLFDEQAEAVFDSIDVMAERVRKVGGLTVHSIGHISQLQTIADDNDDFVSPGDMVRRLMDDNAHIAKMIRNAIPVCDRNRDSATSNQLQDILDKTERRTWFLFEVLQGMKNTD
jgi:starvation-inducible DNA-binding protein